jgi:hypothetical protein
MADFELSDEVAALKIWDLRLRMSQRACAGLQWFGCETIGQAHAAKNSDLRRVPNMGNVTIKEIRDLIEALHRGEEPAILKGQHHERDAAILEMRERGATIRAIMTEFGLSKDRVEEIIRKQRWLREDHARSATNLTTH